MYALRTPIAQANLQKNPWPARILGARFWRWPKTQQKYGDRVRNAALIMAAGSGERLGKDIPKAYVALAGVSLLRRSIQAFHAHPEIGSVHAVIAEADGARYLSAIAGLDLPAPIAGGATRQDSVRAGLEALAALPAPPQRVLIHDAARPFVAKAIIDGVLSALERHPAAIPALAVSDSLKRSANGLVAEALERKQIVRAQTPQGFDFDAILAAHRAAAGNDLSDDAAVAEQAGLSVAITPGSAANEKITTPEDLARAEFAMTAQSAEIRTGFGFDVHRFGAGDSVRLAGISIAHERGLTGHSDADVALHALTDAILGAIADHDIGHHFPPGDAAWKDRDSAHFLAFAADRVRALGGQLTHVDLTLICEAPKIAPHREAMRARIADILALPVSRVSVKATTSEGLGFTGRREGIAAQAVATVRLPDRAL